MLTLDLMEKLLVALGLVARSAPDYLYAEEPVTFYFAVRAGGAPGEEAGAQKRAEELGRLRADILELARECEGFHQAVPVLDLLRWFRRDPWYQIVFNAPRLYLRSLYFSTLKTRLGIELDDRLGAVKERVIGRKIQDLLRGQKVVELSHYRENPGFDFAKLGLPVFAHTRSLTLVANWLAQQCKGALQEAAQLASSTVLANNRILQGRLGQGISGLEDLEARIVLFDRSLSPEEDDGKQLGRFRVGIATDLLLQKSYRALVVQKDREARDLLEKAKEHAGAVRTLFDELRASTLENTRSLLKTIHPYRGRPQTLGQVLNGRADAIGALLKLLDQLLELEKGA
jgi:hypothetical protein